MSKNIPDPVAPDRSFLAKIPKVELHLHLEGAIPIESLWVLVDKYGDPEVRTPEQLQSRFRYTDFPHFIETWNWKNQFLREYDDFTFVAEAVAADLAGQNVLYAEVFFSPPDFADQGLETGRLAESIRKGIDRQAEHIEIGLIGDVVRDRGPGAAEQTVRELFEARSTGIVGIGMGGSEQSHPPEPFSKAYELARHLDFHTTAHAGEAAGPESIWGALNTLRVERLGHGTRAIEDPKLVSHLASTQIPVECCPVSNLRTGVVSSMREHPIRRYFDQGLNVSVHTDDPKMFDTSLTREFSALGEALGFTSEDTATLIRNAIASSWASPQTQSRLSARLDDFMSPETTE